MIQNIQLTLQLTVIISILPLIFSTTTQAEEPTPIRYLFPRDPSVLNARLDFAATGDGKTDDTKALQNAIDASCGIHPDYRGKSYALFIPDGTYRVTSTLVVKNALGPWLYGESRDGVIIKLDDGVQNVNAVLRSHPHEKGPTSADWFMRNLRNFTIDVGNNPQTDGIRYYSTNTGSLQQVTVKGHGKIGINSGFLDQSGPNLIKDVLIEGFETGILSQWIWGETLCNIHIRNCRKVGVEVSANVAAIENLLVEKTPLGLEVKVPNDWGHWSGVVSLIGAEFKQGNPQGPAIINSGILYARNIKSSGFQHVLTNYKTSVKGDNLTEFISSSPARLFPDSPAKSLNLPIKSPPHVTWESNLNNWLCANDFGAVPGDNQDDTEAIEKALQSAASQGKTVVYFRGCGGPDPNWYQLSRPLLVPSPIRLITGLGWARILRQEQGGFIVNDQSSPVVKFQNIDAFGGTPVFITNASTDKVLCVESSGVSIVGDGQGDIFITDCPGTLELKNPGQHCWARHFNPEGTSDTGLVINRGANLWCLGIKHEGRGIRFATHNHGKTEILGLFNYGGYPTETDLRPLFLIDNSQFSLTGYREIAFDSHTATIKVQETRGTETRELHKKDAGGWVGWPLYSGYPSTPEK